jgi:hypothetical protein
LFLEIALHAGISLLDFWDYTPIEVTKEIKNSQRKADQRTKSILWGAWHNALLIRQKRLPSLRSLLSGGKSRKLEGEELERRRKEFKEMSEAWHRRPR